MLPRARVIGEKDMHACLSSRSYRAVQSFTGLPFDALLDSRVITGPTDGNTIYGCLMPASVARAASARRDAPRPGRQRQPWTLIPYRSAWKVPAGSGGSLVNQTIT